MNNYFISVLGLVLLIALVVAVASPGPADSIPPRVAALVLLTLGALAFLSWLLRRPPASVSRVCAHCGRSRCVTDLSPLCRVCADNLRVPRPVAPGESLRIPRDRSEGAP